MMQEFFPILDAVPLGDLWVLLAWGLLAMVVWMFVLWLLHFKLQNAGVVDFGWAAGLAFLGAFYAFKADGYGPRRFLIGTMVFLWGARLAWHLLTNRVLGKPEDLRYAEIRERWKTRLGLKFFFFFEFQALLAVFLSVPFALLAIEDLPYLTGWEWVALVLWGISLAGEAIADSQLKHFKADPENQGQVCEEGLWHYFRHPHYFFEGLIWSAYVVAALATPYGAWTLYCPLLRLYMRRNTD